MRGDRPSHRTSIRVYYEDTDAGGVVYYTYYAAYLKYAERGRTEFLRTHGFDHPTLLAEHGIGFVIRRCEVDYLRSAALDDGLLVETVLTGFKGARFEMTQRVLRNDTILCDLAVTLACMDAAGRPARLPHVVRQAFARALGSDWEGKG